MDFRRIRVGFIVTLFSAGAGSLAGILVAFLLVALGGGLPDLDFARALFGFALLAGACLGTILGPIAAFGFLRRVPLGRLFGQTIVGAVLGGIAALGVGIMFPRRTDPFVAIFGGGALGFALAAALLWHRFRASPAASSPTAG